MTTDHRLFKLTWDTIVEYHKPHEMREKFAKTNLFDGDGVWTCDNERWGPLHNLEDVLLHISPEEEWTCDNCTVTLASTGYTHRLHPVTIELVEEPGVYSEGLGYATEGFPGYTQTKRGEKS